LTACTSPTAHWRVHSLALTIICTLPRFRPGRQTLQSTVQTPHGQHHSSTLLPPRARRLKEFLDSEDEELHVEDTFEVILNE